MMMTNENPTFCRQQIYGFFEISQRSFVNHSVPRSLRIGLMSTGVEQYECGICVFNDCEILREIVCSCQTVDDRILWLKRLNDVCRIMKVLKVMRVHVMVSN